MEQHINSINVSEIKSLSGFKVRTCNANEMSGEGAQIGHLWQRFYSEIAPELTSTSQVYGVYTHYESDVTGDFDVYACTNTPINTVETDSIVLAAGHYLRFSGQGSMPHAVIDIWGQVWQYFSNEQCPHIRAYKTDYEFYKSSDEVEVFISVG